MNKIQLTVIAVGVLLFAILYLGFDTKPAKHRDIEKQRQLASVSTDISFLLSDAKKNLPADVLASIQVVESSLNAATADSIKVNFLKRLSSLWYDLGNPAVSGHYAEEIATLEGGEESWSIAGTTYSICIEKEKEDKIRSFCTERAIQSLENAASLNPSNLQHKVNLAIVYAENPPGDNPMKGPLMLMELNKQFPGNPIILTQLGRLAIKTGQFEKAVERLGQALTIEPENPKANCLMVQAYEGLGDEPRAAGFRSMCDKLSDR